MGVRRGLAAVLCVAALALAGCSDGEASPEPSESVSPTASPSPTGPSIPPEAQGTDEASAKAFVRFWFATLSKAMQTGATADVRALSAARCQSCSGVLGLIDDTYGKGGRYDTKGWKPERLVRGEDMADGAITFLLRVRESERTLLNAEGDEVDQKPASLTPMRIALKAKAGSWQTTRLDLIR
jgi:hypothetical protein